MANNAIPDSIITNMICRKLLPLVEPKDLSTEVPLALTSKNTLRILNTIKPVTKAFTAMDMAKLVIINVPPQVAIKNWPCKYVVAPIVASQVARGDKSKLAYQMKILDWLTYVCNCQERRNGHDEDTLTPHDPTTIDLLRSFRWINKMNDSRYNGLYVLGYIERGSHNNRLLYFES